MPRWLALVTSLRFKVSLAALVGVGLCALLLQATSSRELRGAYAESERRNLAAIAETLGEGLTREDLQRPALLRAKLRRLVELNPELRQASLFWREEGRVRTSTTDVRDLTAPTPRELAPLLDGRARFDEEEELGEPTLELDTPVAGARGTRPFASVELELGLAPFLERAALRRRHILLWALGGGLLLAVGLALFLTRAVARPLDEMRELTRRVGAG